MVTLWALLGCGQRDDDGDGALSELDCDDASAAVHPGAPEVCNGVDDDCDGAVDDEVASAPRWFADTDGDGHGDPTATQEACERPAGHVAASDDCDDTRADIAPGLPEVCGDGFDNDCAPDVCRLTGAHPAAEVAFGGEPALTDSGPPLALVGDLDGDGAVDLAVSRWWAEFDHDVRGEVQVLHGPFGAPSRALAEQPTLRVGDMCYSTELFGLALGGGADLTGDGRPDLLVGQPADCNTVGAAGVWIVPGGPPGSRQVESVGIFVANDDYWITYGRSIATGDFVVNPTSSMPLAGDGSADLLIGAFGPDSTGGGADLVLGPITADRSLADSDARFRVSGADQGAGWRVAAGELDGDGLTDLAIAAPLWDEAGLGAVIVSYAPFATEVALDTEPQVIGGSYEAYLGDELAIAGDLDGDGDADLVATEVSRALVFRSPLVSSVPMLAVSADEGAVTGPVDLDGDGAHDLVVGRPEVLEGGHVGVWYGPIGASTDSETPDLRVEVIGGWATGRQLATGDLDGDGVDDLVFGGVSPDDAAERVYVFHGAGP